MAVAHVEGRRIAWRGLLREPAIRGAQLLAASGFALAQPLFDILGKNAEFFAARGSTPGDIVLFALVVTFVPALALLLVELVVGAVSRAAGFALHLAFLGGLGAVFGVQALKRSGLNGTTVLIVGAVVIGAAIALAAWRLGPARWFLTVLAGAPPIFLAVFLFGTPVEKLVFPSAEASAAAARARHPAPVVFLLFDEFPVIDLQDRSGAIDAARFPNFARLARGSIWFRNTTTLSANTTVAVPVILTGKKAKRGALPIYQDHPNNLFTLLGRRYRMVVKETQTRLCPARLCKRKGPDAASRLSSLYSDVRTVYLHLIAPPALEERLPVIDESWGDFGANPTAGLATPAKLPKVDFSTFYRGRVRDFNRFVGSFRPPGHGPPTLYYLHVLLPHAPWLYFPDGRVRAVTTTNAPGRNGERWWSSQLAVQAWQRHLLQLGYTDRLLGRFLRRLHRTGLWDKALVVVTSDHGVSFRGGDLRRHATRRNLAELAFTPLFVKLPGQEEGRIVDARHVRTVDLLPTIADVLGVRIPWRTDGRSALVGGAGSRRVNVAGVRAPYASTLAQRRRSLERQLGLFGSGGWGTAFSGTGRYRGLVGTPLARLRPAAAASGAKATLDAVGSRLLLAFPRRSPLVPSPLAGTLSGVRTGDAIAFALNGRVAAVSVAYRNPAGGPLHFSELADESAFHAGRNSLRAFVVTGPQTSPELRELRVSLSR
jgi:Sulfatase